MDGGYYCTDLREIVLDYVSELNLITGTLTKKSKRQKESLESCNDRRGRRDLKHERDLTCHLLALKMED